MTRTMQHKAPFLASVWDTVANVTLAGVAVVTALVALGRWIVADRRKVDDKLASLQQLNRELWDELHRAGVIPCRGVKRAKEIATETRDKLTDAKSITSRRPVSDTDGEWGE